MKMERLEQMHRQLMPALSAAVLLHVVLAVAITLIQFRPAHWHESPEAVLSAVVVTITGMAEPDGTEHRAASRTAITPSVPEKADVSPLLPVSKESDMEDGPHEAASAVNAKGGAKSAVSTNREIFTDPTPASMPGSDSGTTASVRSGWGNGIAGVLEKSPGGNRADSVPPDYILIPKPRYPAIARQQGWEGTTILLIEVREDGTVGLVEVLQGSGYSALDEAAVKSVHATTFRPALHEGKPTMSRVKLPIVFSLNNPQ